MDRTEENEVQPNANVSSTDFLHELAAPTLPPVKWRTAYNWDAAFVSALFGGLNGFPFKKPRQRADKAGCDALCRVGYNGIISAKVDKTKVWSQKLEIVPLQRYGLGHL